MTIKKNLIVGREKYPGSICNKCGHKYGKWTEGHVATFWDGVCGWCLKNRTCAAPSDYHFPKWPI